MQLIHSIRLRYTTGRPAIKLRELTGYDEMSIADTGTASALQLINYLLVPDETGNRSLRAEKIVTADRDHLLAILYMDVYGKKIDGTLRCKGCGESFTIDFQLPDLEQHLTSHSGDIEVEETYYIGKGSFRLPTGEDELAVAGLAADKAADELLRLCITSEVDADPEKIQDAMSMIAPVIQTEMKAYCPECGASQQARFDIQSYLLGKLRQDQNTLMRDVHRLASTYKWNHGEIMELPRRLRRAYVKLVEEEMIT